MKFTRVTNNSGQFTLIVERDGYDAFPPVMEFTADHAPKFKNPEREAIASTLLFGPWVGGEFEYVQKIGPNTVAEIRRFCEPLNVSCQPMEFYPKPLPLGHETAELSNEPGSHTSRFIIDLPSDKYNGAVRTHHGLAVATNSFMLKQTENDFRPSLGVAVLFAEDFDVDTIVLRSSVELGLLTRYQALLSACRLGIKVEPIS